jgi:hypothetical protein
MTELERQIAWSLRRCTFLPGSFDKRFVKQLPNWQEKEMTEKGRAMIEYSGICRRYLWSSFSIL